jgi:hypothetical protein
VGGHLPPRQLWQGAWNEHTTRHGRFLAGMQPSATLLDEHEQRTRAVPVVKFAAAAEVALLVVLMVGGSVKV